MSVDNADCRAAPRTPKVHGPFPWADRSHIFACSIPLGGACEPLRHFEFAQRASVEVGTCPTSWTAICADMNDMVDPLCLRVEYNSIDPLFSRCYPKRFVVCTHLVGFSTPNVGNKRRAGPTRALPPQGA